MRQAILQAAASGDIEQLRVPIDMNELRPMFGKAAAPDPIAYFKAASGDGNGREILAILYSLLTTGYAVTNPGTKNEMIVWPYHAVMPPSALTPSQEVELYRFVPPGAVQGNDRAREIQLLQHRDRPGWRVALFYVRLAAARCGAACS